MEEICDIDPTEEKILIIVGDVHGDYNQLMVPYKFHKLCPNSKLIYIGDYCSASTDNYAIYEHIMATIDDPNIIYIRGNHESRNFDRVDSFYKYKVVNFVNGYAVNSELESVDELSEAKYLFTHAEFARDDIERVSQMNEIPVENTNDFIYHYEKNKFHFANKYNFQNIFGHHHAYDLGDETMDEFMKGNITKLCIDIDSSYMFHNGSFSSVCFLVLKKDGYKVFKKEVRYDPRKYVKKRS